MTMSTPTLAAHPARISRLAASVRAAATLVRALVVGGVMVLPTLSGALAQSLSSPAQPVLPAPPSAQSGAAQTGGAAGKPGLVENSAAPAALAGQAQPLVSPPLPMVPGAVPWDLLGQVKQVKVKNKVLPEFAPAVAKLDKQEVKVAGFMMPLQSGEKQSHFLLTVTSQTCSFCIPAGPEGIIEVRTRTPVKSTFDPILIAGRLEVLRDDPMGLYYRINNGEAQPIR